MSTTRWQKAAYPKDASGRLLCRCGCGRYPTSPHLHWFSNKCGQDYLDSRNHHTIRRKLMERDKGICAICGRDCERDYKEAVKAAATAEYLGDIKTSKTIMAPWKRKGSTGWEADHVIPVAEGGGGCGLENFRILCTPCHKAETHKLATRRAAKNE